MEYFLQVSNSLSLDSSLYLTGLKDLGFDLSSVGALVFGYTTVFTYYDILLASAVLANPECLFLVEAPDVTLMTRSDLGTKIAIPCNNMLPFIGYCLASLQHLIGLFII